MNKIIVKKLKTDSKTLYFDYNNSNEIAILSSHSKFNKIEFFEKNEK